MLKQFEILWSSTQTIFMFTVSGRVRKSPWIIYFTFLIRKDFGGMQQIRLWNGQGLMSTETQVASHNESKMWNSRQFKSWAGFQVLVVPNSVTCQRTNISFIRKHLYPFMLFRFLLFLLCSPGGKFSLGGCWIFYN